MTTQQAALLAITFFCIGGGVLVHIAYSWGYAAGRLSMIADKAKQMAVRESMHEN